MKLPVLYIPLYQHLREDGDLSLKGSCLCIIYNNFIVCIYIYIYIYLPWYRASLMYSSKTNNVQRYTMVFIIINAVHVSGGSSAHHQELKTLYIASGFCRAFSASYRYHE